MNELEKAFYELNFELSFLKKKGNEFQNFFCDVMEFRYSNDFIRVRPWGKAGDQKNDGYLRSQRKLFQVYGPNELKVKDTIDKIDADFKGALPYWQEYFSSWVFVHNAKEGLPPQVCSKLLELSKNNSDIKIETFGYPEFREELFKLSENDISKLLGPVPTQTNFNNLGFDKLKIVLLAIGKQQPPIEPDIHPVPRDKLIVNRLSHNVEILIKAGMSKSNLVADFFSKWSDPTLGDQIAKSFSDKYAELRSAGLSPDDIFMELHSYAGGEARKEPDHEAAVLAVLAYLFEECDIFERVS